MGMLSEDRKDEGLALGLDIADNLTMTRLSPLRARRVSLLAGTPARGRVALDRAPRRSSAPAATAVGELSGGNQQKVAIARLLHHDVDVLLLDEPTRGIDVGSKAQIYRLIDELVADGARAHAEGRADGQQLSAGAARLCDRIAVMRRGRLERARAGRTR